jgi:hypothetical protein
MIAWLLLSICAFTCCQAVNGLSVEGHPWQVDVYEVDFIGLVPCIQPGENEVADACGWSKIPKASRNKGKRG